MSSLSPTDFGIAGELQSIIATPEGSVRRFRLPLAAVQAAAQGGDILALIITGVLASAVSHLHQNDIFSADDMLLAVASAWSASTVLQRLERASLISLSTPTRRLSEALAAVAVGMLTFAAGSALQHHASGASLPLTAFWGVTAAMLLTAVRAVLAACVVSWCGAGRICRRVVIVGTEAECHRTHTMLGGNRLAAISVAGVYSFEETGRDIESDVERFESDAFDIAQWGRRVADRIVASGCGRLDAIVIAVPESEDSGVASICGALGGLAGDIYVAAGLHLTNCRIITDLGGVPAGLVLARPLSNYQMLQKDIFDLFGSLVLLLLAAPFLFAIAALIRLDSPGPALFRQVRTGYNNRPFVCLKFRTMRLNNQDGPVLQQATRGDCRVTRIGAWLRRTSVDELPQLLNVLRGEMSLVGPRPHAPNTTAEGKLFADLVGSYGHRHRMKPGITGWAQVNGWRGETPDRVTIEKRVEHDMHYIRNWSFLLDLHILLRTAICVINDPQAY